MAIGHSGNLNLKFNGKNIEEVENYKYLGIILRSMSRFSEDIFVKHTLTCVAKPREPCLVFGKGCETTAA